MAAPQLHGERTSFSATKVLEKLGASLVAIRETDDLTWIDVGRALGKSDDRAAAYAAGLGKMDVTTFLLGCREWNGRFANDALGLIGMKLVSLEAKARSDRSNLSCLTRLLLEMSVALENDDEIDDSELASMRATVEMAGQAVDHLRERLRLKAVAP